MKIAIYVLVILALPVGGWAAGLGECVRVEVRSDAGRYLPVYPLAVRGRDRRAYLEAVRGENYSIVVRNLLSRRIGVVVAVDGRNIISGKKSRLSNSERMYILDPFEAGEFKGWRTGRDKVNRFYFTNAADSYAAAFKDESAMGVIAVAVYPEIRRDEPTLDVSREKAGAQGAPAPSVRSESAGTGFGSEEFSPSRTVAFEPESTAAEKIFLKYEWRSSLCRKGIIECGRNWAPPNRMWDDEGYAPPPPGWR